MTQFERIKAMSVEELAAFVADLTNGCEYGCGYCAYYIECECHCTSARTIVHGVIKWLESEVECDG